MIVAIYLISLSLSSSLRQRESGSEVQCQDCERKSLRELFQSIMRDQFSSRNRSRFNIISLRLNSSRASSRNRKATHFETRREFTFSRVLSNGLGDIISKSRAMLIAGLNGTEQQWKTENSLNDKKSECVIGAHGQTMKLWYIFHWLYIAALQSFQVSCLLAVDVVLRVFFIFRKNHFHLIFGRSFSDSRDYQR